MKKSNCIVDGSKRARRFKTQARLEWYGKWRSIRWCKRMATC